MSLSEKISSREWILNLPLDYADPDGPKIEVFAREMWKTGNRAKDMFVFL